MFRYVMALSVERAVDGDIIAECPICKGWHRLPLRIHKGHYHNGIVMFNEYNALGLPVSAYEDEQYGRGHTIYVCIKCTEAESNTHVMLGVEPNRVRELLERR